MSHVSTADAVIENREGGVRMLTINERFEINAAIERLLADGAAFDPGDAGLLIEKVPLSRKRNEISFRYEDHTPDKGVEGFASGLGNVRIDAGKPRVKEIGLLPDVIRVGGYKILHRPGKLQVELMWADTNIDLATGTKQDRSVILLYDRLSKRPRVLTRAVSRPLRLVLWPKPRVSFDINFVGYVPWKTPATPGGLDGTATASESQPTMQHRD